MSEEGDIFREVEQDMRREQLARLWDRYGLYALLGAFVIVAGVGGYNIWGWWQARQAADSGARFAQAMTLVQDDKTDEAVALLTEMTRDAPWGYRVLAKLEMAALAAKAGETDEAVALYDQVAATSSAGAILTGFSRIQAAALRLDAAEEAEIVGRLQGMTAESDPWRFSAKELMALAAYRAGNGSEAEKRYGELLADPLTPADLRLRAERMLSLMVQAPGPGATGSGGAKAQGNATQ